LPALRFDPETDLTFDYGPALPGHANGMILMATDDQGDVILRETYYSIGGGFVLTEHELATPEDAATPASDYPFPFPNAVTMLEMAAKSGKSIAEMKRANELVHRSHAELDYDMERIWQVMNHCIDRG